MYSWESFDLLSKEFSTIAFLGGVTYGDCGLDSHNVSLKSIGLNASGGKLKGFCVRRS